MPIGLREELTAWKARTPHSGGNQPVFLSGRPRDGERRPQTVRNAEARLKTAIKDANAELEKLGIEPIGESVSPHSLRRTYASMRAALRDDPVYIAEQLGHRDSSFTFSMYQRAAKRREKLTGDLLGAYDRALDWARMGTESTSSPSPTVEPFPTRTQETALES
jgi:integrase